MSALLVAIENLVSILGFRYLRWGCTGSQLRSWWIKSFRSRILGTRFIFSISSNLLLHHAHSWEFRLVRSLIRYSAFARPICARFWIAAPSTILSTVFIYRRLNKQNSTLCESSSTRITFFSPLITCPPFKWPVKNSYFVFRTIPSCSLCSFIPLVRAIGSF